MTDKRLLNRVAVVTGAAQGIGFAIAERLAREGARIIVADIQPEAGAAAAARLRSAGHAAENRVVDIADDASVADLSRAVEELHGHCDILVNNAAISDGTGIKTMSMARYSDVIEVNQNGAVRMTLAMLGPILKAGPERRIVNIASIMGVRGWPEFDSLFDRQGGHRQFHPGAGRRSRARRGDRQRALSRLRQHADVDPARRLPRIRFRLVPRHLREIRAHPPATMGRARRHRRTGVFPLFRRRALCHWTDPSRGRRRVGDILTDAMTASGSRPRLQGHTMFTHSQPLDPVAPLAPIEMPRIGMGCAPLGDLFADTPDDMAQATLDAAWQAGVRFYDTAPWYGHGLSEHRLGAMLRQAPRREFYLTTKVGRVYAPAARGADARVKWAGGLNFAVRYDYSAEGFAASLAQSRMRLAQSSIDALIIHDLDRGHHGPDLERHFDDLAASGLDYLKKLKSSGEIAAIGMGMNALADFAFFVDRVDVDFFIVAMPYTLLDQESLEGPMARCIERGIGVVIGAPFASGILADPTDPAARYAYEPAGKEIREKGAGAGRLLRPSRDPVGCGGAPVSVAASGGSRGDPRRPLAGAGSPERRECRSADSRGALA